MIVLPQPPRTTNWLAEADLQLVQYMAAIRSARELVRTCNDPQLTAVVLATLLAHDEQTVYFSAAIGPAEWVYNAYTKAAILHLLTLSDAGAVLMLPNAYRQDVLQQAQRAARAHR